MKIKQLHTTQLKSISCNTTARVKGIIQTEVTCLCVITYVQNSSPLPEVLFSAVFCPLYVPIYMPISPALFRPFSTRKHMQIADPLFYQRSRRLYERTAGYRPWKYCSGAHLLWWLETIDNAIRSREYLKFGYTYPGGGPPKPGGGANGIPGGPPGKPGGPKPGGGPGIPGGANGMGGRCKEGGPT
jgi:hypothetical protein